MPTNQENTSEVLLRPEAAAFLRISKRTLDYLVAAKEVPFFKAGKKAVRFRRSSLLRWIEEREV